MLAFDRDGTIIGDPDNYPGNNPNRISRRGRRNEGRPRKWPEGQAITTIQCLKRDAEALKEVAQNMAWEV